MRPWEHRCWFLELELRGFSKLKHYASRLYICDVEVSMFYCFSLNMVQKQIFLSMTARTSSLVERLHVPRSGVGERSPPPNFRLWVPQKVLFEEILVKRSHFSRILLGNNLDWLITKIKICVEFEVQYWNSFCRDKLNEEEKYTTQQSLNDKV